MKTVIVLYMPVIHKGYLSFLCRHKKESEWIGIIGEDVVAEFSVKKEIRALEAGDAVHFVKSLDWFDCVEIFSKAALLLSYAIKKVEKVVMIDDEISRKIAEVYFKDKQVVFDSVFLRWDEASVLKQKPVSCDEKSFDSFDRAMMAEAAKEAEKSSCWWRRVGTAVVKDGKILFTAYNRHLPTEHTPYINGDPRDFIKAGEKSEYASSIHSEAICIAWAAREGISLKSAHLYVTVFPCPACAKLIAFSGISKLFFKEGHASLDGEEILKSEGVKIVFVE